MDKLMQRLNINSANGGKMLLALGIAAIIAVIAVVLMWSMGGKYKVVFSNFSDKDGGAIVAALDQMNIPYKLADGGASILVPEEQVYQVRLKLASMGLPKAGNVGFELLETQKFGVSQFVEQVNYQRALEGELERSIQSIAGVENARVHLAIPKSTVFIREDQKPTASVLVKMASGRLLEQRQVSAIVHLVSSSVPNLTTAGVDIVDNNGILLSDQSKKGDKTLDASQMKYIEDIQNNIASRVQSIISPIVGAKNVKAEASVDIDFSSHEEANEIYRPNQEPKSTAIRSMQSYEVVQPLGSSTTPGSSTAGGVPGALTNQPPPNPTAPLAGVKDSSNSSNSASTTSAEKKVLTNFEVDKTITYAQKSMGGIKKLSVAVVVNNKQEIDKDGNVTSRPLNENEKTEISELAKKAMGFDELRGDSLTVVNTPFNKVAVSDIPDIPIWQNINYINMVKDGAKVLISILAAIALYLKVLKPMLARWNSGSPIFLQSAGKLDLKDGDKEEMAKLDSKQSPYQRDIDHVQTLAKQNPKVVANVVSGWVNGNAT